MLKATSKRTGVKVRLGQQREPKVLARRRNSVSVREERRGHPPSRRAAGGSVGAVAVLEEHAGALPEASCMVAPSLTWMVFITPLASTAIFPATLFTPCLNCVMSGPEGSTPSKPELLPVGEGDGSSVRKRLWELGHVLPLPFRSPPSPNRSAELMAVLPDRLSSLVLASYWNDQQRRVSGGLEAELRRRSAVSPRRCSPGRRTCLRRWPWRWRTSAAPRWTPRPRPPPRLSSCWEVWEQTGL